MTENELMELGRSLREVAWQFGSNGLEDKCCENISMVEFLALEKAAETEDCPVQDIGLRLGFTKSGATRIVNRLEKKGYVIKCKSPEDGRVCCVVPTESGMKILDHAKKHYLEKLNNLLLKIPEEKVATIKEALSYMAKTIDLKRD